MISIHLLFILYTSVLDSFASCPCVSSRSGGNIFILGIARTILATSSFSLLEKWRREKGDHRARHQAFERDQHRPQGAAHRTDHQRRHSEDGQQRDQQGRHRGNGKASAGRRVCPAALLH